MNRQQLQRFTGFKVRAREQPGNIACKFLVVLEVEAIERLFQKIQVDRGVFKIGKAFQTCGTPELNPDAFDPAPHR